MNRLEFFDRARSRLPMKKEQRDERDRNLECLQKELHGEVLSEGPSSILAVRYTVSRSVRHGDASFSEVGSLDTAVLRLLFSGTRKPEMSLRKLLFFDVETTGLSGGAGTNVFLVGFLRVSERGIEISQYFLSNLSSERLFLRYIQEELRQAAVLVSYNGKGYDYNLIKSRYILNGFPLEDQDPLHLDLLFTSRRIWKGVLPDFTLSTVERTVLGFGRPMDIPGWRIPEVYFNYIRGRDVAQDLHLVFEHNRLDLLSLLALLIRQVSVIRVGIREGRTPQRINPASISDMLLKKGYPEEAKSVLEGHLECTEVLKRLGLIYKRQQQHHRALELFTALADRASGVSDYLFACTEAAKLCEHVFRDMKRALSYAEGMRERLMRACAFYPELRERLEYERSSVERRIERLMRRLSVSAGKGIAQEG